MGQNASNVALLDTRDWDRVDYLCRKIVALANALPKWAKSRQRPAPETITGGTFHIEARVAADYEKNQEGALLIRLVLKRRGPGRHRSCFVNVRLDKAGQRLR